MIITYDRIYESLVEKVDNGKLTLEQAEEINEIAYVKYVQEGKLDSLLTSNTTGIVLVGMAAAAAIVGIFAKIKGDKNFKNNTQLYPELEDAYNVILKNRKICESIYNQYTKRTDKLDELVEKYNEIARITGSPTITVTDNYTVPYQELNQATDFYETQYKPATSYHEQQNRNYDSVKAKEALHIIKSIEKTSSDVESVKRDLKKADRELALATREFKKVLRKFKDAKSPIAELKGSTRRMNNAYNINDHAATIINSVDHKKFINDIDNFLDQIDKNESM